MKNEKIVAGFVVVLFLLPVGLINGGMLFEESGKGAPESPNYDFSIGLKGKFDPLKGERANIPNEFRLAKPSGYYILQVKGPSLKEWQDELESIGVINYGYIPNFAYLVRMSEETRAKAEKLSFVRWIGNYEPGYKVDMSTIKDSDMVKLNVIIFDTPEFEFKDIISRDIDKIPKLLERTSSGMPCGEAEEGVGARGVSDDYNEIMQNLICSDRLPIRPDRIRDTIFGKRDFNEMFGPDDILSDANEVLKRYNKFAFDVNIESLGGCVVEWTGDSSAVIELDASKVTELVFLPEVQYVSPWQPREKLMDIISGGSYMAIDYVQAEGFDGSKWAARFGTSKIIGAHEEPDTTGSPGGCRLTNQGFGGRVKLVSGTNDPTNDHGTACTGELFWGPELTPGAGILPKAYGGFVGGGVGDTTAADAVLAQGGYVLTHSYFGYTWEDTPNSGAYTAYSKGVDDVLYARPKMVFQWGAGNCPYGGVNPTEESGAKNTICTGGVYHYDTAATTDDTWDTGAGCRGPCDDGRVKPDLCGPYDYIKTLASSGDTATQTQFGGTSGAGPIIAGCAMLVEEMYVEDWFGNNPANGIPYATTVKALLIANAEQYPIGQGGIYRNEQGWGYPKMSNIYDRGQYILSDEEYSLATGGSRVFNGIPSTSLPFKVTLVWRDPSATAATTDDDATVKLVNDLNLRVVEVSTGKIYYGNMGLKTALWNTVGAGTNPWGAGANPDANRDDLNNVENVFIENPSGAYDIYVEGYNVPQLSPQPYSLVVSGIPPGVGRVIFGKIPAYHDYADTINVTLVDADLNTNNATIQTATLKVNSTKDPAGFTMTISETGPATATFFTQLRCSKDAPVGVNTGLSHSEQNVIAVKETDTIQVSYYDTAPTVAWRNRTIKYDSIPPKISNVRISWTDHNGFVVEFETDEPAKAEIFIALKWNISKYPRDDKWFGYSYEDMYLDWYDLATLDDIRNGDAEFMPMFIDEFLTEQGIWSSGYPQNSTVYFAVGAFDELGNEAVDNNAGKYYCVRTVPQPFHILIVDDDTPSLYTLFGYGLGAALAYTYLMFAGYYPTYKATNSTGEMIFTDNFGGYNWSVQWNKTTFQDYWNGFLWDSKQNGVPNILIYDHGWCNAHYAYNGGIPARLRARNLLFDYFALGDSGYTEDMVEFPGWLYTAAERSMIQNFIDNNGKVAFYGSAVAEEYLDIVATNDEGTAGAKLPIAFLNSYMHAAIANIAQVIAGTAAGTAGVAEEFDVTMGYYTYTTTMGYGDKDYGYVGFEGQSGAKIAKTSENYNGSVVADEATSGDVIGVYTGGVAEYRWGKNKKGSYPAADATYRYMAVSYESGTKKTFYSSAGLMSWNYWMGTNNELIPVESNKFYVDEWYTRLVSWFAAGKLQNITGTVTYSGALANATIQAYAVGDWTKPLGSAWSNKTGGYTMKIAPGTYNMVCWKPGLNNATLSSVAVSLGVDKTGQNFALAVGVGNITGQVKVTDPRWGEMRVSGVRVTASSASAIKQTRTDSDGYYGLYNLPTGTYTVTADTLDYIDAVTTYISTNSSSQSSVSVAQDATTTINFLLKTGAISGRVYDASTGKALKNAFVYAVKNGTSLDAWNDLYDMPKNYVNYDFTAEDGTYYLSMLGTYSHDVRACADGHWAVADYNESINEYGAYIAMPYGYSNSTQTNKPVTIGSETGLIDFAMANSLGTLKGVVTNQSSGLALSGVRLVIEIATPAYMKGFYGTAVTAYTGIDGTYSVKLPAGTYNVSITLSGYKIKRYSGISVSAGGTTTQNVPLTPGAFPLTLVVLMANYVDETAARYKYSQDMWWNSLANYGYGADDYDKWFILYAKDGYIWIEPNGKDPYCKGWPLYDDMKGYDLVIYSLEFGYSSWACPEYYSVDDDIISYMDAGGSLLFSAHDYPYACQSAGVTATITPKMHVVVDAQDYGTTANKTARGVSGNAITDPWFSTPKATKNLFGMYEDDVSAGTDAEVIFTDNADSTKGLAVRYPTTVTGIYKCVYFSLPFEAFTSTAFPNGSVDPDTDTYTLFNNLLQFLGKKFENAPILSNPYTNRATGGSSEPFRYFINWTDLDNNAPVALQLVIDGKYYYNVTTLGYPVDAGDTNYRDGKGYYIDITNASVFIEGEHTYNFSGKDSKFPVVGATGTFKGPTITDTKAPEIAYAQSTTSVPLNTQVAINGTFTDNVKVDNVTLYWRFSATKQTYTKVEMTLSGNQLEPGDFRATIPGQSSAGTIFYYLEAGDGTFVNRTGNVTNYQIGVGGAATYGVDLLIDGIGNGLYGTVSDGAGGTSTWTSGASMLTCYPIVLQNEGSTADTFTVPSAPTNPGTGWTASLYQSNNVTQISSFPWTTPSVSAGGTYNLYLKITAPASPTSGDYSSIVGARSVGDISKDDSVTATATVVLVGASPTKVTAARNVNDIVLGWTDTGTTYNIYRSTSVDGTGFSQAATGVSGSSWTDTGRYADSSNYSWVVNATGNATKSNIAFKLCMGIIKPKAPNLNWVSLPYNCPYANIKELAEAVNPDGADTNVGEVRYWDATNQLYMIATYDEIEGWGGASYLITPGMAVMLAAKTTQTWKIVGSHNKSTVINILKPKAPNLNWVSLPYHCSYANIKELAEAVNPGGADTNVGEVRYWDATNQLYMIATYDEIEGWGGASYLITPGMAVMLAAKTTQTWTPAANNP